MERNSTHEVITDIYSNADAARSLVCDHCWNGLFAREAFRDIWENPGLPTLRSFSYSSNWNRIDASSRTGCNWCSLLLSSLEAHPFFHEISLVVRVAFRRPVYTGRVPVSAQLLSVWVNDYELFNYPLYTLPDDLCADEVLARDRIRQMKSAETCRLALDHMSYCLNNHKECPKPSQDRMLPTRVIDCTDPERPRLYITDGRVRAAYVVLSYVWGEDQPNKTKRCNIDEYSRGIDVSLLPQTTRDAIWAAHAFGEKYLWIDALCIVQDSKEDKRREIAKIPRIFADASFTIIAARSSKASEGFLHDCLQPSIPIYRVPFPCKDEPGKFGTMYVEQDAIGKIDDDRDVDDPVHKRAWCLEERLLSARALVYTSNTLRFHCQLTRANVGSAVRDIHDLSSHRLGLEWMPGPGDPPFDPKAESEFDYNKSTTLWDNIVHNYTGRMVTQSEDKLVALAGVASRFSARWKKGEYLAGLWLDNLQHDLMWRVADGAQLPRPEEYRAPSWSWASVEGPVEDAKLHPHQTSLYGFVNYGLTLASDILPFGGVTAGYLTITAPLLGAKWRGDGLYARPPQADSPFSRASDAGGQPGTESRIYYAWRDTAEILDEDVWLLPVCWGAKSEELQGLVVIPAGGPTEYRRVGCFRDFPQWVTKDDIQELDAQDITLI